MLLVINLFFHIPASELCFTSPASEELIILPGLYSIISLQECFPVISVHVLMSIADPLGGFSVLALSFPFAFLHLELAK